MNFKQQSYHRKAMFSEIIYMYTLQIDLALDVEVALPYWIQRRVGFVHRRQKLHLNTEGNPVLKQIRRIVEGNFLSKESVCEKAVEVALVCT